MGARYSASKYSKQKESEIRYTILSALQELAQFNGIDINTIQTTAPYSFTLTGITSQKMAAELKKLIDGGMVVKGAARGKTMKYMMRTRYNELMAEGELDAKEFGYGDYRDAQPKVEVTEEEESDAVCERIRLSAPYVQTDYMW